MTTSDFFASRLNEKFPDYNFTVIHGRVYDKLVVASNRFSRSSYSVHAFMVVATDELVKAASWEAPQKNMVKGKSVGLAVRYTLDSLEAIESVLKVADPHGGYLYSR